MLIEQVVIAALLTVLTTVIHGGATAFVFTLVTRHESRLESIRAMHRRVLVIASVVMLMLGATLFEALIWALAYLGIGALDTLEPALYFSIVTFTTLGYGDVLLDETWRLVASLQAAAGIVMFGWSTALVISVAQRLMPHTKQTH